MTGTIYSNDDILHNIDRGWALNFENEKYYVTYAKPTDRGNGIVVEFDAVHEFFYKMRKSSVYTVLSNGSHTADAYLEMIFKDSGYNYALGAEVTPFEKQDFGMDTRLSLFNDFINQTGLEFSITKKNVTITSKIGSDLSTIVRKGFNLQELGLEYNIGDFVTYCKGFGAYKDEDDHSKGRLEVEYTSALSKIYGKLEAPPFADERYTIKDNLLKKITELVDNSFSISVALTVEDLQASGYEYSLPNPGDYILAVDEALGFSRKIRILSVEIAYDIHGERLQSQVTCGALSAVDQKNQADANSGSVIDDLINGDGTIPNDWLNNAIIAATEALQNTETELKYTTNGILAIDKNNANNVVVYNSAGLGVSTDGGKTFGNAITGAGINATAITTGILKAISVIGVTISGSSFETTGDNGEIFISDGRIQFMDNTGKKFGDFYPANQGSSTLTMMMESEGSVNINSGKQKVKRTSFSMGSGFAADSPVTSLTGEQVALWLHYTQSSAVSSGVEINKSGVLIRGGLEVQNNTPIDFYSNVDMHGYSIQNQSDIRLKENITPPTISGIKETKRIKMAEFDFKQSYDKREPKQQRSTERQFGIIAQSTPFLSEMTDKEKNHYLSVNLNKQVNLNTLTNQELIEKVERLESRLFLTAKSRKRLQNKRRKKCHTKR